MLILLFVAYYLTLDASLAAFMLVAYAILDAAGRFIPAVPAVGLFVFGWILQGVGHYVYEKNSPAFFRNSSTSRWANSGSWPGPSGGPEPT